MPKAHAVPYCEVCKVQPRSKHHYEKNDHAVKTKMDELQKQGFARVGQGYACLKLAVPELLFQAPIYSHNSNSVDGWWAPWWASALAQRTGYKLPARTRWLRYFLADEEAQKAMEVAVRGFKTSIVDYLETLGLIEEGDKQPVSSFKGTRDWHDQNGTKYTFPRPDATKE